MLSGFTAKLAAAPLLPGTQTPVSICSTPAPTVASADVNPLNSSTCRLAVCTTSRLRLCVVILAASVIVTATPAWVDVARSTGLSRSAATVCDSAVICART